VKVYRMVCLFVDHDDVGPDGARSLIENARLPNHISPPDVMSLEERDIGEWRDSHPLNFRDKRAAEFARLFGCLDEPRDPIHELGDPRDR
jgi:hypothetical protein